MSTGPEPSDLDRDVDESMRMFEKSKVGPASAIRVIEPSRVMLVLDGSEQDETSVQAASYLRNRFNTETLILDARDRETPDEAQLSADRARQVTGARPIRPWIAATGWWREPVTEKSCPG